MRELVNVYVHVYVHVHVYEFVQVISLRRLRDGMEVHLRHEPEKVSKSRIKRLRGIQKPQYRLRVDEFRVFYDVHENTVEVLAIVSKSKAGEWLKWKGIPK